MAMLRTGPLQMLYVMPVESSFLRSTELNSQHKCSLWKLPFLRMSLSERDIQVC